MDYLFRYDALGIRNLGIVGKSSPKHSLLRMWWQGFHTRIVARFSPSQCLASSLRELLA
jgi:hypothetical protein